MEGGWRQKSARHVASMWSRSKSDERMWNVCKIQQISILLILPCSRGFYFIWNFMLTLSPTNSRKSTAPLIQPWLDQIHQKIKQKKKRKNSQVLLLYRSEGRSWRWMSLLLPWRVGCPGRAGIRTHLSGVTTVKSHAHPTPHRTAPRLTHTHTHTKWRNVIIVLLYTATWCIMYVVALE